MDMEGSTWKRSQSAGRGRNLLEWSRHVADCRSSGLSLTHWCAEHSIKPKTYYNWQKKAFAAMLAQQAERPNTAPRFAELLPLTDEKQPTAAEKQTDLVASVRIGAAALDVYSGASGVILSRQTMSNWLLCRRLACANLRKTVETAALPGPPVCGRNRGSSFA